MEKLGTNIVRNYELVLYSKNDELDMLESVPSVYGKVQSSLGLLRDEPCTHAKGMLTVMHVTFDVEHLAKLVSGGL